MKKYKKIISTLIIILFIVIVVLLVTINYINQNNKEQANKQKGNINIKVTYDADEDYTGYRRFYEEKEYGELNSYEEFFIATQCINKYINYAINENNINKAYNLLDKSYINNNTKENLQKMYSEYSNKDYYIRIKKVNNKSIYGVHVYYLYGDLVRDDEITGIEKVSEFNNGLVLDFNNFTFSVIPNIDEEYLEKLDLFKNISINGYNKIEFSEITDDEKTNNYIKYYLEELKLNIDNAFNMLDEEYKLKRFNNDIEEFKKYIDENYYYNSEYKLYNKDTSILEKQIYEKYAIEQIGVGLYEGEINKQAEEILEKINKYKDENKNYQLDKNIIIKERSAIDFKVMLDRYTVETDIMKQKYNDFSEEEKVAYNCENIIDSIVAKNYNYSYEHFVESEKNKFNSVKEYESAFNQVNLSGFYIDNYNIQNTKEGYTYTANLKNIINGQIKRKVIIKINLSEGMNFNILTLNIS